MPLDPEALALVEMMSAALPGGLHCLPIVEARTVSAAMAAGRPGGPDVHAVADRTAEGPRGPVPVRIYHPGPNQPWAALLWFHGGAFAFGSLDASDATCRELAAGAGIVVVSVAYRLAPEHPFPAGLEDCEAVLRWVAANADELGIDPDRIAVGGDSAGATLAASVALKARDTHGTPIAFQLLAYPTTLMRISSYEHVNAPIVPASMTSHFWQLYVTSDDDLASPYCAPGNAETLAGLPPALILIPEVDSTRRDQEDFAHRLAADGVLTTVKVYPGTPHGFFTMSAALATGRQAVSDATRALRAALGSTASPSTAKADTTV